MLSSIFFLQYQYYTFGLYTAKLKMSDIHVHVVNRHFFVKIHRMRDLRVRDPSHDKDLLI